MFFCIFFVEKKDHTLKITVKNHYPLPRIPVLFQRLQGAQVFSKGGRLMGRLYFEHYVYLVMPFGLGNASATVQYFVNDIFWDYKDLFIIV